MAENNIEIAFLVHSCDRYEFLFKGFEAFFIRYWNFEIPCNYYFATEEKDVSLKGFTNIKSGKGEWSDRLKKLLDKEIKEPYVLYFQEDMWLDSDVSKPFFEQLFLKCTIKKMLQIKLHSSEVYTTVGTNNFIEGFNISKINNVLSGYLMSHQVTLWNKDFLIGQLQQSEHPWRNERNGTKRLKTLNPIIFHIDYFAENGKPPINQNNKPIMRSGYKTVSENSILNINVMPFIELLLKGNEAEIDYAHQLQYHYKNHLTHDGKAKPRKEDFFQKLKKWLRK